MQKNQPVLGWTRCESGKRFAIFISYSSQQRHVTCALTTTIEGGGTKQGFAPAGLGQYFVPDLKPEGLPVRAGVRRPACVLIAKHRVVPFEDMHGLGCRVCAMSNRCANPFAGLPGPRAPCACGSWPRQNAGAGSRSLTS
jgi:hypothetical protein